MEGLSAAQSFVSDLRLGLPRVLKARRPLDEGRGAITGMVVYDELALLGGLAQYILASGLSITESSGWVPQRSCGESGLVNDRMLRSVMRLKDQSLLVRPIALRVEVLSASSFGRSFGPQDDALIWH